MDYKAKKTLLCTFTNEIDLHKTIETIESTYNVVNDKIIILFNVEESEKLFCIYNIFEEEHVTQLPKTILLHRKKETNTLYTINSLNKLV